MTTRRLVATLLVTAGVLTLATCDDDDGGDSPFQGGGEGSREEFCTRARDVAADPSAEVDPSAGPEAIQQVIDVYADLEQDAPDEVRADIATLRGALEQAAAGDIDALTAPDVQVAISGFQSFVTEECDVTPPTT